MATGSKPPAPIAARLAVLFLLAALLFNPPILSLVDRPITVAGVPLAFVYLFIAWSVMIFALARIMKAVASGSEPDRDA